MKKSLRTFLICAGCSLAVNMNAEAGVVQYLIGINYFNPAMLNSVKKQELIVGCDIANPRLGFKGTSLGVEGTASSDEYSPLPYGRVAFRVNPKIVLGFSITEPYFANINWGDDSVLRFVSTETTVNSIRYEPQISYQVSECLALGFSLEISHIYNYQLNFAVPNLGVVTNEASSTNIGFSAGFFYVINPTTFLDAAYHSNNGLFPHHGTSTSESGLYSPNYIINGEDPPLAYVELIHQLCPKFLLGGKVIYSRWSEVKTFELKNTVVAPNLNFEAFMKNTWSLIAYSKYDFNDTYSGKFGVIAESNFARSQLNSVAYPGSSALGFAISADIHYCKWTIAPTYMKYFYVPDAKLENYFNRGTASLNGTLYGLRFTYEA